MLERTTVINVRGRDRLALLSDPDFVYVGRAMGRAGWNGSIWGNPYCVKDGRFAVTSVTQPATGYNCSTAAEAVDRFRHQLFVMLEARTTPANFLNPFGRMASKLSSLRGKKLGCWCVDWDGMGEPPKPCHAVELARLADATLTEAWATGAGQIPP